ncbi:hypothetical protein ACFXTO_034815 [Malus domestica]
MWNLTTNVRLQEQGNNGNGIPPPSRKPQAEGRLHKSQIKSKSARCISDCIHHPEKMNHEDQQDCNTRNPTSRSTSNEPFTKTK